jgi:hypothetical protein
VTFLLRNTVPSFLGIYHSLEAPINNMTWIATITISYFLGYNAVYSVENSTDVSQERSGSKDKSSKKLNVKHVTSYVSYWYIV